MNHPYKGSQQQCIEGARPGMRFRSRPYDMKNLYVSLKQWRILHAVIDCGGFAEAAKALYLSQSTISYTIAKLQEQLGVPLLRIEGRKAVLTNEGRALLERSRNILKEAIELELLARQLGQGCAGEVRLVVDQNCPPDLLMPALHKFNTQEGHGSTIVRLREVSTLQAEESLREQEVDLAISESVPLGFLGEPLAEIEYVAVANSQHPLLALGREATGADLARHVRIAVGQGAGDARRGASCSSTQRKWAMNSFDSAVTAVLEGLGFAWLPQHRIRKWLEDGSLVPLPLVERRRHKSVLYLIHGRPWMSTAVVARLADVLRGFSVLDTNVSSQDGMPA